MKKLTKIAGLLFCVVSLFSLLSCTAPRYNQHYNQMGPSFDQRKLKLGVGYISSNPGVYINLVQFNSLAYNAGIVVGDIIVLVDTIEESNPITIQNGSHFQQILQTATGKVQFGIINPDIGHRVVVVDFSSQKY